MDIPVNRLKQELGDGRTRYGIFVSSATPVVAEMAAASGLEWLIVDAEHAPNDMLATLVQLQATTGYPVSAGVRLYESDQALMKRVLDIGAQTVMVPMVDTAEQAEDIVRFTRYPPDGVRGVASGRAARWGLVDNYFALAADQICVIAQIETAEGLANIAEITAVDGIDVVFIGPSDLGASLGHLGASGHPEVQEAVVGAIRSVVAGGKAAGVFATTPETARVYEEAGATLLLVGVDLYVLRKGLEALVTDFSS